MATPLTGRQGLLAEDIYGFLQGHEQARTQSAATGSSEFIRFELRREAQQDALAFSQDSRSRSSKMHVSSAGSGETRPPSIFDLGGYSSSTSSVLPRRQQQQRRRWRRRRRLPCEFYWYGDCQETFDLDDVDGWVRHVGSQHLDMILPTSCRCWFCDDFVFRAESETMGERRRCYAARIRHIAEHYRRGATTGQVRPDFDFLDHLRANDLITIRDFRHARDFHEAPQPKNGINSVPAPAPSAYSAVAVEVRRRPRGRRESRRSYYP
ncbi:hypothetical protein Trco_006731 [Trichoderma cornu-damae]|uniref:Uncharacterized protein n=1 Tax=Trichoderma cornu-damae TaxID=654480 RepID=A0A9P8QHD7_9HYPO|nr:hypothetical protein Trco_006731 [Trichoderma cornu-damae]